MSHNFLGIKLNVQYNLLLYTIIVDLYIILIYYDIHCILWYYYSIVLISDSQHLPGGSDQFCFHPPETVSWRGHSKEGDFFFFSSSVLKDSFVLFFNTEC